MSDRLRGGAPDGAQVERPQHPVATSDSPGSSVIWRSDVTPGRCSSAGFAAFTGRQAEAAVWSDWLNAIHPHDRALVSGRSLDEPSDGRGHTLVYRLWHNSGAYRWVEDRAIPIVGHDGRASAWVGVVNDIHGRMVAEQALRDSEERLRLATAAGQVGIWDVDLRSGERRWSTELKSLLGLPADAQESEALLLALVDEDDRPSVEAIHRELFQDSPTVTFRIRRADSGEVRWITSVGRPILGEDGRPVRRLGTFQDVTERKQFEAQLWRAANHDALTGLPNRAMFSATLDKRIALARSLVTRLALVLVDVDHFKVVNDTLGHAAGDCVLQRIAERLKRVCGEGAFIGRLGGDEFAVLLTAPHLLADITTWAEQAVTNLAAPIWFEQREIIAPSSLGLAIYPDHDRDPAELLKNADLALYASKRNGRARFSLFEPAMRAAVHRRATVLRNAREALIRYNIEPYYQPKVGAGPDGQLEGFEALLRWRDGGLIKSPAALAEALEDPDLSVHIGQRMLELVSADVLRWQAGDISFGSVAVNLSAAEFARGGIAERWLSHIGRCGLDASTLQVEVTETVFLEERSGEVGLALQQLHEAGVKVALDDFGTGYASLTHLRRYPVDLLKIDRSFVADLEDDPGSQAIVTGVIDLAQQLGIKVVAEGVETERQRAILASRDCDFIQGFLIAKPMAASRVSYFIRNWARSRPAFRTSPAGQNVSPLRRAGLV